MSWRSWAALLAAFAICAAHAGQAAWPARPVTIVVPYTPATGADVIARLLQPRLGERLGAPVIVENKAGASGAIGTEHVAKSAPDGYTLLLTATSHGTIPAMSPHLPYDALKSFADKRGRSKWQLHLEPLEEVGQQRQHDQGKRQG